MAGWSHLSNNATLWPNVQVRTCKTWSWLPSWAECGNKKRRAPNKIYQKEMFYKPRILYMELTHKLRIGDIYHANICLCNICTGYKCHQLRVCATISKMYPFSNYSQFESPNLTKLCFLWKWLCTLPIHHHTDISNILASMWMDEWWCDEVIFD